MTQPTSTLEDLRMLPATAFTWPITCRWTTIAPWGTSQQILTADVPQLVNDPGASSAFGRLLWSLAIAPAISSSVLLQSSETMCWKGAPYASFEDGKGARGQRFASPANRDNSGQFALMTGVGDSYGVRRLFLPGIPHDWVAEGLLVRDGWEGLLNQARALYMGLKPIPPDAAADWLVAYIDAVPRSLDNFYGVGFRRILDVRVCQHVDRAPDAGPGLWP